MNNKTLFAIVAIAGVIGATALVTTAVSAFGPFGAKALEDKAEVIGMSVEELQVELENKTLPEILDEQGISHTQLFEHRQGQMLERKAELLGMTIEELETQLEEKPFHEILDEQGITHEQFSQDRHEQMQAQMTDRLQSLVDEGTITEEQMQEKLDFMSDKDPMHGGGFHGHMFE